MNCNSTHSPRCLKLVKRSHSCLWCSPLSPVLIPVSIPVLVPYCFAPASEPFGFAQGKLRPRLRVFGNKKGATCGPRLLDHKLTLYFQNIKLEGANRKESGTLYCECFHGLKCDRVIPAY